mmetsp:Transcript_41/g.98  ORF Transcript_41/g.98 Transcript_41/m.98 type:complete len:243 (+) Transcript_41:255-983(+)
MFDLRRHSPWFQALLQSQNRRSIQKIGPRLQPEVLRDPRQFQREPRLRIPPVHLIRINSSFRRNSMFPSGPLKTGAIHDGPHSKKTITPTTPFTIIRPRMLQRTKTESSSLKPKQKIPISLGKTKKIRKRRFVKPSISNRPCCKRGTSFVSRVASWKPRSNCRGKVKLVACGQHSGCWETWHATPMWEAPNTFGLGLPTFVPKRHFMASKFRPAEKLPITDSKRELAGGHLRSIFLRFKGAR